MRATSLRFCILLLIIFATSAHAQFWCWDTDEIVAEVDGHSVRIEHLAALYNCCPDPITYDVEVGDATIFIQENTLMPCDCECCYDLTLVVADVPPGPWNLLFRWFDVESWQWTERVLQVEVPDVGQTPPPYVADAFRTECLETTSVPDETSIGMTWGAVKALCR